VLIEDVDSERVRRIDAVFIIRGLGWLITGGAVIGIFSVSQTKNFTLFRFR